MTDDITNRLRHLGALRDLRGNSQNARMLAIEAADEIEKTRDMCIRREEFIAQRHLWADFSKWLSEPADTGSVT